MRQLYRLLVPYEVRLWLYMQRHPSSLRDRVNHHPKGDFSLRAFDQFKCIFVHITKSAGTSVAKSLFGELPYHHTAVEYRVIFGRRRFNEYFKFAFVRNPWDRLYSAYCYLRAGGWDDNDREWFQTHLAQLPDFNAFVLDWLSEERLRAHIHLRPQSDFICDWRGMPLLDYLGYFETLNEDFVYVANRLGSGATLAHENASSRGAYRVAYSSAAIEKVKRLYARDIEKLGYEFEGIKKRVSIGGGRFA